MLQIHRSGHHAKLDIYRRGGLGIQRNLKSGPGHHSGCRGDDFLETGCGFLKIRGVSVDPANLFHGICNGLGIEQLRLQNLGLGGQKLGLRRGVGIQGGKGGVGILQQPFFFGTGAFVWTQHMRPLFILRRVDLRDFYTAKLLELLKQRVTILQKTDET